REWGVPVHDDQQLFECLILEGAQAGLSWITVLRKRDAYRDRFAGFDPTRVKVVTERGIVYLMGLVTTAEGNAAAEAVRQVRGVRKVVKVFEYLDEPPAAT
ncbi:MAG: DNA-3-methyladenine glycosylase I, partial [Candidatus Competibacterales bacterium]|nr:DNA-3-methyladenine glycosylase I [Candidatus Competibacterales bacterium]